VGGYKVNPAWGNWSGFQSEPDIVVAPTHSHITSEPQKHKGEGLFCPRCIKHDGFYEWLGFLYHKEENGDRVDYLKTCPHCEITFKQKGQEIFRSVHRRSVKLPCCDEYFKIK
jgi:hypothetical protein